MELTTLQIIGLLLYVWIGWLADRIWGDPEGLPHPIVYFGKWISWGERHWNNGKQRTLNGALFCIISVVGLYALSSFVLMWIGQRSILLEGIVICVGIFYCLSGCTLIREVRMVFEATDRSLEEGRKQVSRIVGRDTQNLSAQEIRAAALETLSENLSDGVIAPLFWYALLGLPGMITYKLINTFDSMVGYKTARYLEFGKIPAHLDDIVNYIPARITAFLMVFVSKGKGSMEFVRTYGKKHASPNSGYPEAALASILCCRFGGPHNYFGEEVWKPYIGEQTRTFTTRDMELAIAINAKAEVAMLVAVTLWEGIKILWL